MASGKKIAAMTVAAVVIAALMASILNMIFSPVGHDAETMVVASNDAVSARATVRNPDDDSGVTSNPAAPAHLGVEHPIRQSDLGGPGKWSRAAHRVPLIVLPFAPDVRRGPGVIDETYIKAAGKVTLADVAGISSPPLELARQKTEKPSGDSDGVRILTGFECSVPLQVKELSSSHFLVTLASPQMRDWFMFRMEGVAGKTVRIDLAGGDQAGSDSWLSLNPVYTDAKNLDDLSTYSSDDSDNLIAPAAGWNGPLLPATTRQQWHYITDTWMDDERTKVFSFVRHFDSDAVFIAMKVPRPPGYNEQFFHQLSANPLADVIEVGRSGGNRPLSIVKIGSGGIDAEKHKPCILIYAGEHADEHDAMWGAQGAIEYLLGDTPSARQLRDRFTFLVIPMLDPDASASGRHEGIMLTFLVRDRTPEAIAYANWFQAWINAGKRLDVVLDFHNVQSRGAPSVSCALLEGLGARGKASAELHSLIVNHLQQASVTANPRPWMRGWSPDRLGGWLSSRFGPITLAYELNSQAADRHLNLEQQKAVGGIFAGTIADFFSSPDGAALLADVDARRQERLGRWAKYGGLRPGLDAIQAETYVADHAAAMARLSGNNGPELLVEKVLP